MTAASHLQGACALSFRHQEILEIARRDGRVLVDDLAEHFGVTHQTIRRDLTELAEDGQLNRVHGGAILRSSVHNLRYEDRRRLNEEAKDGIAAACAAIIPEHASLFLNIGTTTEAVARALLGRPNLMVVTNSINVANILAEAPSCEIVLAGGTLRRFDGGLTGALTMRVIEQFKVDIAVIGCSAMDEDGDLLDFDPQEVGVSQTIIAQARRTYLVADHMKLARTAPVRIASMADLSGLFTDRPLPPVLARRCASWGTEVVVTDDLAGVEPG
ncbi:MAG: DeoR/GlpR family DNA-binding transcription regulator [Pseudomonadota bacterium]